MKRAIAATFSVVLAIGGALWAQGFGSEPVFTVGLAPDRAPLVAGETYRLAVQLNIDPGWHINSNVPGDEFLVPTALAWKLPTGWTSPSVVFPPGEQVKFGFSDKPISVWQGHVVAIATGTVPADAAGSLTLTVVARAQACNDTQCLPPTDVEAGTAIQVAPAGSPTTAINSAAFVSAALAPSGPTRTTSSRNEGGTVSRLAGAGLPLQLLIVFLAGLALNLTPCVYPLIPITIGFFAGQAKERRGGTFGLALVYVLGMSVTYSVLGVAAALTGKLFGAALQSPIVIGVIVVVLIALALSMFGLWELKVPGWALRASGGKSGLVGALLMGLLVGFVAAPCIGPFVLGLLTYVGQVGSPALGFILFFTLAMGLGVPYLLLGTFTGAVNKMPASGAWMIGVRKIFGILLIALAVYFARPLMPAAVAGWLLALALILGGLWMLVFEKAGREHPAIGIVIRLLAAALIVAGVFQIPRSGTAKHETELPWQPFEAATVRSAVDAGRPVIIDFYADWCAPCKELDAKTFADPQVARRLADYDRFKVNMTRSSPENTNLAKQYSVRGVPTIILYRDGKEVHRLTGFEPPQQFLTRLQ